jgi:hypothetical protein
MDRDTMEARVDELRAAHPEQHEFVEAVRAFGEMLAPADRDLLGKVLLSRKPDTGGFDVLERRLNEGGWLRRTVRKIERREEGGGPP